MMKLDRPRYLQAPADDGTGASGTGDTSATDAGAKDQGTAGADKGQAADEKGAAESKRSVLKAAGGVDAGAAKDGKDGKTSDSKQDAGAKAKDGAAADEFVIELPKGTIIDKARLETFTKEAKDAGLTAAQASKLAVFQLSQEKAQVEAQQKAWAKQGDDWYSELEKDPEFGGQALKASEAALQSALRRYDPKGELVRDLEKHGIENLPSLAKFFARIGKAAAEDKADVETHREVPKVSSEQERLAKRYPSIKEIQPKS